MGQAFQVHHRNIPFLQRQQQIGLARAGASAHQPQRPRLFELCLHPVAVGFVAP